MRLPALRRVDAALLPGFRVTKRDAELVQLIANFRCLTSWQINRLLFPPVRHDDTKINPRCQHRLKMLYQHGYLDRREQPQVRSQGSLPLVYFLARRGAELLEELSGQEVDWDPDDNDVTAPWFAHLLQTNEVRLSITLAARNPGVTLASWIDDKALKSPHMKDYVEVTGRDGGVRRQTVVPDGLFVLETPGIGPSDWNVYHHALEVDRGTTTGRYGKDGNRDWRHKIEGYIAYYSSGKYQARYGTRALRILTVTTGERRMAHLKDVTERSGGRTRFLFTTFDRLSTETVLSAPIWTAATQTTPKPLLD